MTYNKSVRFEWDPNKAKANWENHRVSFDEVTQLFTSGIDFLEIFDESHSDDEERFIAIGRGSEVKSL